MGAVVTAKPSHKGDANSTALRRSRSNGAKAQGVNGKAAYGNRKVAIPKPIKSLPATAEELDKWHLPEEPPQGSLGKAGRAFYAMYVTMQNDLAEKGRNWITQGDYASLVAHCKSMDDFANTTKLYDREQKRMKKKKVHELNPYQNALHKCIKLVQSTAKELGLTPEKAIRIRQEIAIKDYRTNPVRDELVCE